MAALIIGGGVVLWIRRDILRGIRHLLNLSREIAAGNLHISATINSRDEFGELAAATNTMAENLKLLISQIQTTGAQLSFSAENLSNSAEQSAQATTQIADSISITAGKSADQLLSLNAAVGKIENIAASIETASSNALDSANQAKRSVEAAQEGSASIEQAIQQMTIIEKSVEKSAVLIEQLGGRSQEIGQIVNAIAAIAEQTNLLALNAAIEAARAGEHGKGFAVVAAEVSKLAEGSHQATQQIAALITKIQEETQQAVTAMQIGTREVKVGTTVVNASGDAFQKLREWSKVIAEQVGAVANTVHHEADQMQAIVADAANLAGISQGISDEMQTVSAATEEQSATMEQISGASEGLTKLAVGLSDVSGRFRI